ncbi:MAG: FtsH protease activity modulator HflK [Alphaproteobacteria bacterium]|nr:FtsH protease activity modulator HflK [Alphaproteobacteria bacterium]
MPSDDKPDRPNRDKKNPWNRPGRDERSGPFGGNGPGGGKGYGRGGQEPPDMDEVLRRMQERFKGQFPSGFHGGYVFVLIFSGILLLWLASGFYVVNPGENAVIQRFGAWSHTKAEPGLGYHFPVPIESVSVLNVEEIRKMNIGFAEAFARRGDGSVRSNLPEESLMLTVDRNIVDLNLEVQWNIKSAEDFLFQIMDQEGTIKKVSESAIREVAGQTEMFQIITNQRQQVADRTKAIIQRNLDEYNSGVNITQVLIQKAEVHPDVQDAFQDVQSAKQDAEDTQNQARAYREDILPKARGLAIQMTQEAEGYKQSVVAEASGDAARFDAVYEAYLSGKDVTRERIYIETMENVLKNAQKIILDNQGTGNGVVPYLPLSELNRAEAAPSKSSVLRTP